MFTLCLILCWTLVILNKVCCFVIIVFHSMWSQTRHRNEINWTVSLQTTATLMFTCAVDGHCCPRMQCTKQMEELLHSWKTSDTCCEVKSAVTFFQASLWLTPVKFHFLLISNYSSSILLWRQKQKNWSVSGCNVTGLLFWRCIFCYVRIRMTDQISGL